MTTQAPHDEQLESSQADERTGTVHTDARGMASFREGTLMRRAGLASVMMIAVFAVTLFGDPSWGHRADALYYVPAPGPCAHGCVVHRIQRTGFEIP